MHLPLVVFTHLIGAKNHRPCEKKPPSEWLIVQHLLTFPDLFLEIFVLPPFNSLSEALANSKAILFLWSTVLQKIVATEEFFNLFMWTLLEKEKFGLERIKKIVMILKILSGKSVTNLAE